MASGRSTIASTTSDAPATVCSSDGMQRTACDRRWRSQDASTSPASASVASAVAISPGARSSVSALLSVSRTLCPPSANTSASAWPIRPAPTTATSSCAIRSPPAARVPARARSMSVATSTTTVSSDASASFSAGAICDGSSTRMPRRPNTCATSAKLVGPKRTSSLHVARHVALLALHVRPALAKAGVVVDHQHHGDAASPRGLQFGQVVVDRAVARPADHLALRRRALGAERGRERPAERSGGAQIGLSRAVQLDQRARSRCRNIRCPRPGCRPPAVRA